MRRLAPFDGSGTSIPARYYLANKRSVTLDAGDEGGRERIRELARRCDVVVSSARPSELRERRLGYEDFDEPRLVMTHVTPFGMSGERAELPANDLTIAALSGWAFINGQLDREPLKLSGWQASMCAGAMAYAGTLAAVAHRDRHPGEGQEVDIAELDVMVSTFAPALLRGQYHGVAQQRRKGCGHDGRASAGGGWALRADHQPGALLAGFDDATGAARPGRGRALGVGRIPRETQGRVRGPRAGSDVALDEDGTCSRSFRAGA